MIRKTVGEKITVSGTVCACDLPLAEQQKSRRYHLETPTGHVYIKLSKELLKVHGEPTVGMELRVRGTWRGGESPYLKAKQLESTPVVQVCSKGSCRKGGAQELVAHLQAVHPDWRIETTGCLKACQSCKLGANATVCGVLVKGLSPTNAIAKIDQVILAQSTVPSR